MEQLCINVDTAIPSDGYCRKKLLSPVLLNQSAVSPLLIRNFWLFCSVNSTLIGYLWEC